MFRGLKTGQKIGKFFLFHSCQRQRICTIHKNSKRGQKFLFLTITTMPQVVTKLSETSILIDF